MEWTITTLSGEGGFPGQPAGAPITAVPPDGVELLAADPVSGPLLRSAGRSVRVLWLTTRVADRPAYECLCSRLGVWAYGMRRANSQAQVAGTYPALAGADSVDVELPGFGSIRDVPVERAPDAAARLGPPMRVEPVLWTYLSDDPPRGWTTQEWPTPVPDPQQLSDYRGFLEDLVPRPGG